MDDSLYRSIFEASPDALLVVAPDGRIVAASEEAASLCGSPVDRLVGSSIDSLVPEDHRPLHADLRASFAAAPSRRAMGSRHGLRLLRCDGTTMPVDIALSPIDTSDGPLVVAAVRDMTQLAAMTERLADLATHDPLTGLANRALVMDRLDAALAEAARRGGHVGVLFLDLDGFKGVNDELGHAAGDAVLVEVAHRIDTSVRASDTVGRIGGDEFLVCCTGDESDPAVATQQLLGLADHLRDAVRRPIWVGERDVEMRVSVGVAVAAAGMDSPARLLRSADAAMYRAKAAGGDQSLAHDVVVGRPPSGDSRPPGPGRRVRSRRDGSGESGPG